MHPNKRLFFRAQLAASLLASSNFAQALAQRQPTPIEIANHEREQNEKKRITGLTGVQKEIANYNAEIDKQRSQKKQSGIKNYRKQRR